MSKSLSLFGALDTFFMQSYDLRMLRVIRSGYALLLSLNILLLFVDRHLLFGPDSFLPPGVASKVVDPDTINLYDVLPSSPWTISLSLASLLVAAVALVLEVRPRLAALYIFVLLGWIHHANMLLFDAEDVVFRLFAFFLIFAPPGKKMTPPQSGHSNATEHMADPAWPIRLFQLQICLIYLCSALQKSNGDEWLDGSAVYYSLRLDDMTRFQLPFGLGDVLAFTSMLTWGTMLFEFAFPFVVWTKLGRRVILPIAFAFHLGTDYCLNLHLFHWIMMLGLLSFVDYSSWQRFWNRLSQGVQRSLKVTRSGS